MQPDSVTNFLPKLFGKGMFGVRNFTKKTLNTIHEERKNKFFSFNSISRDRLLVSKPFKAKYRDSDMSMVRVPFLDSEHN